MGTSHNRALAETGTDHLWLKRSQTAVIVVGSIKTKQIATAN